MRHQLRLRVCVSVCLKEKRLELSTSKSVKICDRCGVVCTSIRLQMFLFELSVSLHTDYSLVRSRNACHCCSVKPAFHDADILARIVARMSACHSACHRNNFRKSPCRTCRRGCRCRCRGMQA